MPSDDRVNDLIDHFSYSGRQAAIWEAFDRFLDTDRYLNLGYSSGHQTHLVGSPQRRLIEQVRLELERGGVGSGDRLVDLGCGRGGPTIDLATNLDIETIGIDLVPYNLHLARVNAYEKAAKAQFVRGDIRHLSLASGSIDAITAIDSLVYVDDPEAVLNEIGRVLDVGGQAVVTDLLISDEAHVDPAVASRFRQAWSLGPMVDTDAYREVIASADLHIDAWTDLTPHSVGQFRPWTSRYLKLRRGPTSRILDRSFDHLRLDGAAIDEQVEAAHDILPELRHIMVRVRPQ